MLLTCNEWEYFVSSGEDLARDQTGAVLEFMRPLLTQYRDEARAKIAFLEMEDFGAGVRNEASILKTRWQQIVDASDVFLS